nr:MAG TPA: hypothetical protein [Caudoviricetes sp.]
MNNQNNQEVESPRIDSSMMHEFVQKEMKELEVRQEEIRQSRAIAEIDAETQRQKNQLEYEIALRSLEVQQQDRAKRMDTLKQMQANDKSIWVLLIILSFAVIITAFWLGMGKEIMELVKYAITAIVGYFAGVAKGKFEKNSRKKLDPPEE